MAIFWSSDRSALKRPFADLAEEIGVRRQQSFAGGNRHRDAIAGEWLHLKVASWRSRPVAAARHLRKVAAMQSFDGAAQPASDVNWSRRRRPSRAGAGDQVAGFVQIMEAALLAASKTGSHTGENGGA